MSNLIYAHVHILTKVCILAFLGAYFSSLGLLFHVVWRMSMTVIVFLFWMTECFKQWRDGGEIKYQEIR